MQVRSKIVSGSESHEKARGSGVRRKYLLSLTYIGAQFFLGELIPVPSMC